MAITYIPVVGQFTYRASPASPAAGERVVFVAASDAIVDGEAITLPTKLAATLTSTGELPTGFTLPTLPGGVYYVVHESFSGAREDYTIFVQPSDTLIDLATVVPAVPPEPLVQYLRVQDIGVSVGSQAMAADHETRIDALETGGGGGGGADLSDNVPHALGTAAAGIGTKASRDDHVHAMPTATDVGADVAGAATSAIAAHVGAADPHPQYTTPSEAAANAPVQTVAGRTGAVTLSVNDVTDAVDTIDARLSDAREWTAATVTQAEAEAGTDTNRKAWSVLRVWQAIAAWWAASSAKTKLDGIAAGATVGADWNANVSNKPALGTAAAHDVGDFATAAQGAKADSALQPNAPITGATKTKITYDADGLITAGADATTADIADSTNKRYVTDAQLVVIGNTSGTNTGDQTSVTGNAGTATALQNARTIGGVSFDGTADINLPGVNTTGNQNTSGSAATLTTSRNIGGIAFNGSANIEPSVSEVSRTTSWTLGLSDRNTLQVQTHASPQTCTIPPQSSVTWVGPTTILILAHGSGALTLDADTGVTLNGVSGGSVALDRYQNAVLRWISSDVWVVSGTSADVA